MGQIGEALGITKQKQAAHEIEEQESTCRTCTTRRLPAPSWKTDTPHVGTLPDAQTRRLSARAWVAP